MTNPYLFGPSCKFGIRYGLVSVVPASACVCVIMMNAMMNKMPFTKPTVIIV